jgi:hypothetical protein
MEPHDFDKFIKGRVRQTSDTYKHERDAAKPFVWSAVQNNLRKTSQVTGWHLAAAVIAILMLFTLVFYSSQQKHRRELDLVYTKMKQLQQHYDVQTSLLQSREIQLDSVEDQLNHVVRHLEHLSQKPTPPAERPIPKIDTIFIRQVEYVTAEPELEVALVQNAIPEKNEIDQVIFPIQKSSINNQREEAIKVKFGSFTARKD